MEQKIWKLLSCAIRSADRRIARVGRRKRFSDQRIVKMYFWAAFHDRPMCWACQREHYGGLFRPKQLPSVSQFSRRVRSARVQAMLDAVNTYLTRDRVDNPLSFLDGKPLVINRNTRDKEARKGYANGSFERGYKIHAWVTSDGAIGCFSVRPMNEGEPRVARDLVHRVARGSLVLADANYDSAPLYRSVHARGAQLLTPLKGAARSAQQLKRMGEGRRAAIRLWTQSPQWCAAILQLRAGVERCFSVLTCTGGGLTTLPPWVRTLRRVTQWVTAKIAIHNARLNVQNQYQWAA